MVRKRHNVQQKCRLKMFYVDLNLCLLALLLSCTFTARSSSVHYFQAICTMKSSLLYILAVRSYLVRPQCKDTDMLSQRVVQPHMKQSVKCRTWRLLVNFQFGKLPKLADTLPPIQMSESCWWDREQKEIHHPKFSWSQRGAAAIWVAHIKWLSPKCSLFHVCPQTVFPCWASVDEHWWFLPLPFTLEVH